LSDYYIWDCAGGTGNLIEGLNNPRNVFVSDVNIENVYITQGRNVSGVLNLLDSHIFQFDFLNDSFDDLPKDLKEIINDDEKRKKLIIYINPPYAEAMNKREVTKGKIDVNKTNTYINHLEKLGKASRELFVQFLTRIYFEISNCKIGTFSTLKTITAPNFKRYRDFFNAKFLKGFICPAYTFDNVEGDFPIAFQC
jgi:hypothetical protein